MTNPLSELKRIAKTLDRPLGLHTWKVSLKDKETHQYTMTYGPNTMDFYYLPDDPLMRLVKDPALHTLTVVCYHITRLNYPDQVEPNPIWDAVYNLVERLKDEFKDPTTP